MLGTLPGWFREPDIQVAVLVAVGAVYVVGAINRWRHGSVRRGTFYIAAGILLGLWEWHMVWWLFVGAVMALGLGTDDFWRGKSRQTNNAPSPGTTANDSGKYR